jgi:Fe-S-cluster-containing hydrogenase component 2
MTMRQRIVTDATKCCGCRVCELICSLRHAGICDPNRSAVHRCTVTPDLQFMLSTCAQCANIHCAQACPAGAIHRDERTGAVVVDADLCNLCGACVEACPFDQIAVVGERVLKCDLCGGEPQCVAWCPREALSLVTYALRCEVEGATS